MPRRILFVAWAPFFSGAERALLLSLQALAAAGEEPSVVAGTDGEFAAQVRRAGFRCEIQHLQGLDRKRLPAWVASASRLFRTVRRTRPHVIHCNDVPSYQPAGHVGRSMGVPVVTHVRFPFDGVAMRWFLRPPMTRALFVSECLRFEVTAGAPDLFEGRSHVVYDGVAMQPPCPPAEREALKRALGLPTDRPTVALTGQVSEVKGIWDFVEAARLVADRGAACTFAVLGDDLKGGGALRSEMEARVAGLGLASRFVFLGFRPDAPRLVAAFDVVAVPSHVEPLGNATLEAMAAGVPVVGSRVGGIPEMVVDGTTGLLVPARSPAALAEALQRLVGDEAARLSLGLAGRRRAEAVFGLEAHADCLRRVYDGVL